MELEPGARTLEAPETAWQSNSGLKSADHQLPLCIFATEFMVANGIETAYQFDLRRSLHREICGLLPSGT